jgi:hypothetical protein
VPRLDTSLYQSGCIKAATLISMNQIRIITWNKQGKNFSAQQKNLTCFEQKSKIYILLLEASVVVLKVISIVGKTLQQILK